MGLRILTDAKEPTMISKATSWTFALCVLVAPGLAGQQQDPTLVGEGAVIYSTNCTRCHNARSSTERTDAQWRVIVGHMRVRANMTRGQAEAVLAYLQATNLPEGGGMQAGGGAAGIDAVVLPNELRWDLFPVLWDVDQARTSDPQVRPMSRFTGTR
jgi:mono/diheme cytochrome c family protein